MYVMDKAKILQLMHRQGKKVQIHVAYGLSNFYKSYRKGRKIVNRKVILNILSNGMASLKLLELKHEENSFCQLCTFQVINYISLALKHKVTERILIWWYLPLLHTVRNSTPGDQMTHLFFFFPPQNIYVAFHQHYCSYGQHMLA